MIAVVRSRVANATERWRALMTQTGPPGRHRRVVARPSVKLYLDRHDLWRGIYWNYEQHATDDNRGYMTPSTYQVVSRLRIYICPLPCVVVRITIGGRP